MDDDDEMDRWLDTYRMKRGCQRDDVVTSLQKGKKTSKDVIKMIFYKGRNNKNVFV